MRQLLLLFLLIAASVAGQAAPVPRRIVSLNLCADQYLLALADRGQVAALTRLASDPEMSAAAGQAAGLRTTTGAVEDALTLRPDLLVGGSAGKRATIARLYGRRIAGLDLPPAESYADVRRQVRAVAAAVGRPARGEALIARMDARLAGIGRDAGRARIAAHYQRRGFLTGTGTLVDELMRRVGLVNLAARRAGGSLSRLSLEQLALARPDFLIVDSDTDRVADQGTEMLHHPVLRSVPRLRLPQAWTVCGGPGYVLAAESLARQLRRR